MAHMTQEKKAKIAAALKTIMPKGWKWSLSVEHRSTIVLTIAAAPVDLMAEIYGVRNGRMIQRGYDALTEKPTHYTLNTYHPENALDASLPLFTQIIAALNTGNHDNSDLMSDYFDVGHYVDVSIGKWNKDFVCTAA